MRHKALPVMAICMYNRVPSEDLHWSSVTEASSYFFHTYNVVINSAQIIRFINNGGVFSFTDKATGELLQFCFDEDFQF